jgi:hypothetical protein
MVKLKNPEFFLEIYFRNGKKEQQLLQEKFHANVIKTQVPQEFLLSHI